MKTLRSAVEKLKALLQWFVQLERTEHRHWCVRDRLETCQHQFYSWHCRGIFCAGRERRNCPACRLGVPCECHHCKQARRAAPSSTAATHVPRGGLER